MKKILALTLLFVMLWTLCACSPKPKIYKLQPDTVSEYFNITCEADDFEADSKYHNYRRICTGSFTLKTAITPKEGVRSDNVSIKLKIGFGDDTLHGAFGYQWRFEHGNFTSGHANDMEQHDYKFSRYRGNADDYDIKNFKEIEISIPDGTNAGGTSYDAVELVQAKDDPISYYEAVDPTEDNIIIYIEEVSGYITVDR